MLPTRFPPSHNLVSTIAATGVCKESQEETPPMTEEELRINSYRQGLSESLRQAKMDKHDDFFFQNYLKEDVRGWATPMLQQQEVDAMCPDGGCRRQPSASSKHQAN